MVQKTMARKSMYCFFSAEILLENADGEVQVSEHPTNVLSGRQPGRLLCMLTCALLMTSSHSEGPHLAFVCNSNTANQILLAESTDGVKWVLPTDPSKAVFMAGRPECWDKDGVAAGAFAPHVES